jgi:hypothetical protein
MVLVSRFLLDFEGFLCRLLTYITKVKFKLFDDQLHVVLQLVWIEDLSCDSEF